MNIGGKIVISITRLQNHSYSIRGSETGIWYGMFSINETEDTIRGILKKAEGRASDENQTLEVRLDYFKEEYPEEYQGFRKFAISWYDNRDEERLTQIIAYECDHIGIKIEKKEGKKRFWVSVAKCGRYIEQKMFDSEEKAKRFVLKTVEKQKLKALI